MSDYCLLLERQHCAVLAATQELLDPSLLKEFMNEIELLDRLRHPHVLTLYGYTSEPYDPEPPYGGGAAGAVRGGAGPGAANRERTRTMMATEFSPSTLREVLDDILGGAAERLTAAELRTLAREVANGMAFVHR